MLLKPNLCCETKKDVQHCFKDGRRVTSTERDLRDLERASQRIAQSSSGLHIERVRLTSQVKVKVKKSKMACGTGI